MLRAAYCILLTLSVTSAHAQSQDVRDSTYRWKALAQVQQELRTANPEDTDWAAFILLDGV